MATITEPAIHLRFDNNLLDESDNNVQVSVDTGSAFYETSVSTSFDNAFTFNSSNSLRFSNHSGFSVGTGNFTWAFWFKSSIANNDKFIIEGRAAWGTLHITTGGYNSPAGVIRYVGSSTILGSTVLNDDNWHHIAIVRNSGMVTIFLDGVSDGSGTDTKNYSSGLGTWYIGKNSYGGNQITGSMDEFIFATYAVYTSEFTPPDSPYNTSNEGLYDIAMDIKLFQEKTNNASVDIHAAIWSMAGINLDCHTAFQSISDTIVDIDTLGERIKNQKIDISVGSLGIDNLMLPMQIAKQLFKNSFLDIFLTDGITRQNASMDVAVSDGSKKENIGLYIMAVTSRPEFRYVYAMNLSSVIKEIAS